MTPKIYSGQDKLLGCWYEFSKITGCKIKIKKQEYSNDKLAEQQIKKATSYSMKRYRDKIFKNKYKTITFMKNQHTGERNYTGHTQKWKQPLVCGEELTLWKRWHTQSNL